MYTRPGHRGSGVTNPRLHLLLTPDAPRNDQRLIQEKKVWLSASHRILCPKEATDMGIGAVRVCCGRVDKIL